jgi:hypothetical protein
MNNYRRGRTPWLPTDAQIEVMRGLFAKYTDALVAAREALELALL